MKIKAVASALPNMPWQDRPAGDSNVLWRYSANPVIRRDAIPTSNSIFNSAVVPFNGKFAGVFRADNRTVRMRIHAGFSDNAIDWRIDPDPIKFIGAPADIAKQTYAYDPRVTSLDGRYYVTWCNGYHGPTIGVSWTEDFRTFHQLENAFLPFNRNGVLFPKKFGGNYGMLSRPSDNSHTPFGDIFYSESPDLKYWGAHRHVMSPVKIEKGWQSTKIGAGPVPIETSEGWLLIYHGVTTSCNGFIYSFGAALLDLEQPWKVIGRAAPYMIFPWKDYECVGDVPNVCFPCASLVDGATGRLAIYYGAADTVTCLAFGYVDEILEFIRTNPETYV
ncbi:MAG: glycoside hydrolase family 130 protein [Opitutaceae bacterium]|jgi:beta-1,4-mannooligosaccharide/beta-1,4-mannosyl-N-acetylglucosamine phosphorylase